MLNVKQSAGGGRNGLWWLLIALGTGLLAGLLARYLILENVTQAHSCRLDAQQLICRLRSALGWSIHFQLFGLVALLTALLAWLPTLRWLAWPALLLSAGGLLLYNTTYAAIALIMALLVALRD
jgi:hypothetical protein